MIVKVAEAIKISKIHRNKGKKIVLAGGCFDIIHLGHIRFLKNAKKLGGVLFVLLESDDTVGKLKGRNRPINNQKERAEVLSTIKYVDYVVLIKRMKTDKEYDKLIALLKPDFLAATEGDPGISHKMRQAKLTEAKVRTVTRKLKNKSTTRLIKNY
ncbi:MAG: hypothetical protein A2629_01975 [Candidatus Levybacteria bacterium RIFCSPHIGHO2_01_FULL_41_15]|nr:MAG: hypothetical protein A2629_01975 [Candidatus Levybacteria bacterium RIFCSPHIGHO2_01_FULL_41_15]